MKNDIDFICMGFTKCGTTWMYNILSQNPALDNPKLKEPCYYTENFHRGENWQLSLYKNNGGIKTDFTNHYIFNQGAIELIKKNCPKAKLLLLIRNPIERSISHFKMISRTSKLNGQDLINEEYDKIINRSLYYNHIMKLLKVYNKEQILLSYYDTIKSDPLLLLQNIHSFLGLEDFTYKNLNKVIGRGFSPRFKNIERIRNKIYYLLIDNGFESIASSVLISKLNVFYKKVFSKSDNFDNEIAKSIINNYGKLFLSDLKNLNETDLDFNKDIINNWIYDIEKNNFH